MVCRGVYWLSLACALAVSFVSAASPVSAASVEDASLVQAINGHLREAWQEAGITPSKRAPDGAWARRVTLDLLGRVPTVQELTDFVDEPPQERRAWLVDRLLSKAYQPERARWLATEWTILLVGRTGGTTGNSLVHREGLTEYLREAFLERRSYDALMRELVTATGSVRPEDGDYNGAANFLADNMADGGVQATAKTSQLFLGVSVQCTQCHNHPFNEQKQNQFWEMNAFFRQTRVERLRDEGDNDRYARLSDRDFYGEGRSAKQAQARDATDRAEIYYELRNGKLKVAYPAFLDGTPLTDVFADRGLEHGDSGRLNRVNRREELAKLIAGSPDFARAAVNREWDRLLGYGFTRPPHDMGPHNPPSHPVLLDELAVAFRDTGFDIDRLTRWIVLSEAYGLDSRAGRSNEEDDPALGVAPLFSRFYLRQLSAEQIYESLLTATRADEMLSESDRNRARRRWLRQFTTAFGNDENGEATSFNGSIPQALAMMNSELVRQATSLQWRGQNEEGDYGNGERANGKGDKRETPPGFLASVAMDSSFSNADRVDQLYLAALARKPDRAELKLCNQLLAARDGNAGEALRDIWWALLNSNEFLLNH